MRLVFAALSPGALLAADLDLGTRIDGVTVFPDAALVTRHGGVALPAGPSAPTVRGLPASVDPASVRVEGRGTGPFSVGAVDLRSVPGEARPSVDPDLEARIRSHREDSDKVAARLAALETVRAAIDRYAQAGPEKLGDGKPLDVGQWQGAWNTIGSAMETVQDNLRQARSRQRDLEGEIAALERARPAPLRPGAPRRDLVVAVESAAAQEAELRISYRVAGASWIPAYDARLDTGEKDRKPSLDLARRALVSQRTGEDWTDVELAVSTARVTRGAAAPDLPSLQVLFWEPQPARLPTRRAPAPAAETTDAAGASLARPEPPAPRVDATQQQAAIEAGAFQATFRVPGRVSVAQDGSPKALGLGRSRIDAVLSVAASPELDETAYLKASFTHEEEAPLLPGEVSLQRDGTFVGRTRLKLTSPGDPVEIGFGADDRVRVTRVPLRRRENEPGWMAQSKTDLREFKTTVRNLHAQPIRVAVTDRLPFSENTAIVVEQLRETTAPTERAPGDRRGLLVWSYDYAPGEQREIRLAYRMKWPAERDVVFEPRPVGAPPRP